MPLSLFVIYLWEILQRYLQSTAVICKFAKVGMEWEEKVFFTHCGQHWDKKKEEETGIKGQDKITVR